MVQSEECERRRFKFKNIYIIPNPEDNQASPTIQLKHISDNETVPFWLTEI